MQKQGRRREGGRENKEEKEEKDEWKVKSQVRQTRRRSEEGKNYERTPMM